MNQIAIYAGTFDPITNGHLDIIVRASQLFASVIIAVAEGRHKHPHFSWDRRVKMCQQACSSHANVKATPFEGLLIDFARAHQASCLVRGLRSAADFDFEYQLCGMNRKLAPQLETVFLIASSEHAFISSSMVREIAALGGDVSAFVPQAVEI